MKKRHQLKIVFVAYCLMFLWSIPVITKFNTNTVIMGFPSLYFFIFLTWMLAIAITYFILKRYDK